MRQRFGDWGNDLSEADFSCALAALGMLPPDAESSWPVERLAAAILRSFQRRQLWRFRPTDIDARTLAEAWFSFLEAGGRGVPINIELGTPVSYWIEGQLSRPEVGAGFVQIVTRGAKPSRELGKGLGSYTVRIDEEPLPDPGSKTLYPVAGDDDVIQDKVKTNYPVEAEPEKNGPRPRFLQAQLQNQAKTYTASVRVGLPDRDWRRVEEPFPLPEDSDPEGHQLTLLFWEARVCPEPQVRSLWLPPRGSSQPVSFTFTVSEDLESISARVTVLHANRVLQTGLLNIFMGPGGQWSFRLDAVPRTVLEGLSSRTVFDAALVEGDGIAAATDGSAALIHLNDGQLDELTRFLTRQISSAANDPESYAQLDSPGSVELLRVLAQKGGEVHETLCEHTGLAALANAKRIHITSARVGSFFPIELLYSFELPDDTAGLCPRAAEALQRGECPGDCSVDRRQNICPLGFWGLSRIIERHAHQRVDTRIDGDFLLQPEPVRKRSALPVSVVSLLAASGRATEVKATAVDELFEALQKRGPASRASTWKAWTSEVSEDSPSLLVLLPHHEQTLDEEVLEIGQGDRLRSELVRADHVRCQPNGPYPILLLLGCATNLSRIAFDNFVTRFRDKGAAVVVSTIATVLGRQASPAAAHLVELLDEEAREGNSTFGEVMLRLRQKLVATQTPMALGLTAYGDADWVLTRESR